MKCTRFLTAAAMLLATGLVAAEVHELRDDTLGGITAGTGNDDVLETESHAAGGMVVANDSEATVDDTNQVILSDGAQSGASGLNIVNSANSMVGQGLNIWDGQFLNGDYEVDPNLEQSNMVLQSDATRSADVQNYSRGKDSMQSSYTHDQIDNTDTIDLVSKVNVDTSHQVLGQNVNIGLGVGVAGRVGIDLGQMDIGVGLEASSRIKTGVGVSGQIDLPWPLGSMKADGQLDLLMVNEGSFNVDLSTPEIDIDAIGAVCYTKLGVCSAEADDNSTYRTLETREETTSMEERGALNFDQVAAEYIVIDESKLEITSGHTLQLDANAQSNLAAVNAVNAVSSMVANGLNISRTTFDGQNGAMPLNLAQRNVVVQSR